MVIPSTPVEFHMMRGRRQNVAVLCFSFAGRVLGHWTVRCRVLASWQPSTIQHYAGYFHRTITQL